MSKVFEFNHCNIEVRRFTNSFDLRNSFEKKPADATSRAFASWVKDCGVLNVESGAAWKFLGWRLRFMRNTIQIKTACSVSQHHRKRQRFHEACHSALPHCQHRTCSSEPDPNSVYMQGHNPEERHFGCNACAYARASCLTWQKPRSARKVKSTGRSKENNEQIPPPPDLEISEASATTE